MDKADGLVGALVPGVNKANGPMGADLLGDVGNADGPVGAILPGGVVKADGLGALVSCGMLNPGGPSRCRGNTCLSEGIHLSTHRARHQVRSCRIVESGFSTSSLPRLPRLCRSINFQYQVAFLGLAHPNSWPVLVSSNAPGKVSLAESLSRACRSSVAG